jgi:hypothetical protein
MMESFINIHNEYDDEEIKLVYVVHGWFIFKCI